MYDLTEVADRRPRRWCIPDVAMEDADGRVHAIPPDCREIVQMVWPGFPWRFDRHNGEFGRPFQSWQAIWISWWHSTSEYMSRASGDANVGYGTVFINCVSTLYVIMMYWIWITWCMMCLYMMWIGIVSRHPRAIHRSIRDTKQPRVARAAPWLGWGDCLLPT